MFGQFELEPPECDGAVVDGVVEDGVVADGVVVVTVLEDDVPVDGDPVAAFAIATTPPPSAPVQASVATSFRVRAFMSNLPFAYAVLTSSIERASAVIPV